MLSYEWDYLALILRQCLVLSQSYTSWYQFILLDVHISINSLSRAVIQEVGSLGSRIRDPPVSEFKAVDLPYRIVSTHNSPDCLIFILSLSSALVFFSLTHRPCNHSHPHTIPSTNIQLTAPPPNRLDIHPFSQLKTFFLLSTHQPSNHPHLWSLHSCRSSLISSEHAELLRSTPSLVPCCAWLVTMALHVHCGLGQLGPLPTSGDRQMSSS